MNIMPIFLKYFNIKKVLVIHSNLIWLYPDDMPGNKIKLVIQKLFTNVNKTINIIIKFLILAGCLNVSIDMSKIIGIKTKIIYLSINIGILNKL